MIIYDSGRLGNIVIQPRRSPASFWGAKNSRSAVGQDGIAPIRASFDFGSRNRSLLQKRGRCKRVHFAAATPECLDVRKSGTGLPDGRKKKMERRTRRHKPGSLPPPGNSGGAIRIVGSFPLQCTRGTLRILKRFRNLWGFI
mgnify:CR=1 FL=1